MGKLNSPVSNKGIESIINNFPNKKAMNPDSLAGSSTKCFKKKWQHFYTVSSTKAEAEGALPNSVYKASITLVLWPDKDITRKEKWQTIETKTLNKILSNRIQQLTKILFTTIKWTYSRYASLIHCLKIN